jgi:hypothetical protein
MKKEAFQKLNLYFIKYFIEIYDPIKKLFMLLWKEFMKLWKITEKFLLAALTFSWGTFFTLILTLLGFLYFFGSLNYLLDIEFTLKGIWGFLISFFGISYIIVKCSIFIRLSNWFKRNQTSDENNYDEKNNFSTNVSFIFLSSLLVVFMIITVYIQRLNWNNNIEDAKSNKIVLITKYKPLKSQSIFSKESYEFDISESFYQKMQVLNESENSNIKIQSQNLIIKYYDRYFNINSKRDNSQLKNPDKFFATLTGNIIEEGSTMNVQNYLYINDENVKLLLKKFNTLIKNEIIKYPFNYSEFSNPLNMFKYYLDYVDENRFKIYFNDNFDLNFNFEISFLNGLSFLSTLDLTPFITYHYIVLLNKWNNFERITGITKLDTINKINGIKDCLQSLDLLLSRISFISKDDSKSYTNFTILIHLFLIKAYFYNFLFQLDNSNPQYFIEKIDCTFNSCKYFYIIRGATEQELDNLKLIYYYSIRRFLNDSEIQTKLPQRDNIKQSYLLKVPDLDALKVSLKNDNPLKEFVINLDYK